MTPGQALTLSTISAKLLTDKERRTEHLPAGTGTGTAGRIFFSRCRCWRSSPHTAALCGVTACCTRRRKLPDARRASMQAGGDIVAQVHRLLGGTVARHRSISCQPNSSPSGEGFCVSASITGSRFHRGEFALGPCSTSIDWKDDTVINSVEVAFASIAIFVVTTFTCILDPSTHQRAQ
jgi:hypothetical protein